MALIPCKECGEPISSEAKTCPKCGIRNKPRSTWWIWLLGAPVALFVWLTIVGMVVGGDKNQNFQAAAERAVSAQLKDGSSAQFSSVYLVKGKDSQGSDWIAACGLVNGKNSFGALAGNTRFVVLGIQGEKSPGIATVNIEDHDRRGVPGKGPSPSKQPTIFEEVYWNSRCVDDLHPATYTGK
ncbi:MAG: zinc ribbon domain-containing protein [Proteobacteria bacterium]|nr:zinc ribbon domain-containing protein [Pseudomonadota bacterium]